EDHEKAYLPFSQGRKDGLDRPHSDTNDRPRENVLEFQISETEAEESVTGEDEELDERSKQWQHAQQIDQNKSTINSLRSESDQSVITQLDQILLLLEEIKDYQPQLANIHDGLSSSKYDLEEYSHQLAALDNDFDEENQTIDQVEDRLCELSRLNRKYAMEYSEILDR